MPNSEYIQLDKLSLMIIIDDAVKVVRKNKLFETPSLLIGNEINRLELDIKRDDLGISYHLETAKEIRNQSVKTKNNRDEYIKLLKEHTK